MNSDFSSSKHTHGRSADGYGKAKSIKFTFFRVSKNTLTLDRSWTRIIVSEESPTQLNKALNFECRIPPCAQEIVLNPKSKVIPSMLNNNLGFMITLPMLICKGNRKFLVRANE